MKKMQIEIHQTDNCVPWFFSVKLNGKLIATGYEHSEETAKKSAEVEVNCLDLLENV